MAQIEQGAAELQAFMKGYETPESETETEPFYKSITEEESVTVFSFKKFLLQVRCAYLITNFLAQQSQLNGSALIKTSPVLVSLRDRVQQLTQGLGEIVSDMPDFLLSRIPHGNEMNQLFNFQLRELFAGYLRKEKDRKSEDLDMIVNIARRLAEPEKNKIL